MIIVKTHTFLNGRELDILRKRIKEQLIDGVVILPDYCEVVATDLQPGDVIFFGPGEKLEEFEIFKNELFRKLLNSVKRYNFENGEYINYNDLLHVIQKLGGMKNE